MLNKIIDYQLGNGFMHGRNYSQGIYKFRKMAIWLDKMLTEINLENKKLKELPSLGFLLNNEVIQRQLSKEGQLFSSHQLFECLYSTMLDYLNEPKKRAPSLIIVPLAKYEYDLKLRKHELTVDLLTLTTKYKEQLTLINKYIDQAGDQTVRSLFNWLITERLLAPLERKDNLEDIFKPGVDGLIANWDQYLLATELRELLYINNPLEQANIKNEDISGLVLPQKLRTDEKVSIYLSSLIDKLKNTKIDRTDELTPHDELINQKGVLKEVAIEAGKEMYRYYFLNPEIQGRTNDITFHYETQLYNFFKHFNKFILPRFIPMRKNNEFVDYILSVIEGFTKSGIRLNNLSKSRPLAKVLVEAGLRYFHNFYGSPANLTEKPFQPKDELQKQLYLQFKVFQALSSQIDDYLEDYNFMIDYTKFKKTVYPENNLVTTKSFYFVDTKGSQLGSLFPEENDPAALNEKISETLRLILNNSEEFQAPGNKLQLNKDFVRYKLGDLGNYVFPAYFLQTGNIHNLIAVYSQLFTENQEDAAVLFKIIYNSGVTREEIMYIAAQANPKHPLIKIINDILKEEARQERLRAEAAAQLEKLKSFNSIKARTWGLTSAVTAALVSFYKGLDLSSGLITVLLAYLTGYLISGKLLRKGGALDKLGVKISQQLKAAPQTGNGQPKTTNGVQSEKSLTHKIQPNIFEQKNPVPAEKPEALKKLNFDTSNIRNNVYTLADLKKLKYTPDIVKKHFSEIYSENRKSKGIDSIITYYIPIYLLSDYRIDGIITSFEDYAKSINLTMGERETAGNIATNLRFQKRFGKK